MNRSEFKELIRETIAETISEDYAGRKNLKDLSKNELKRVLLYHKQQVLGVGPGKNKRTIENWHHVHMIRKIEDLLKIPLDQRTFPPKQDKKTQSPAGTSGTGGGPITPVKTRRKKMTPDEREKAIDAWYKKTFGG